MTYVKAFFRRVYGLMVRYPLATAAAVLLVVAAIILKLIGVEVQIGGLLDKLFDRKPTPGVRVLPPPARIDSKGDPIAPGQPDDKGYVQPLATVEIKPPGIFSNPDTITVVKPDKTEVTLPLPVGVKNTDVAEVVEVQPNVYQIKNNDSGVNTAELEDILK